MNARAGNAQDQCRPGEQRPGERESLALQCPEAQGPQREPVVAQRGPEPVGAELVEVHRAEDRRSDERRAKTERLPQRPERQRQQREIEHDARPQRPVGCGRALKEDPRQQKPDRRRVAAVVAHAVEEAGVRHRAAEIERVGLEELPTLGAEASADLVDVGQHVSEARHLVVAQVAQRLAHHRLTAAIIGHCLRARDVDAVEPQLGHVLGDQVVRAHVVVVQERRLRATRVEELRATHVEEAEERQHRRRAHHAEHVQLLQPLLGGPPQLPQHGDECERGHRGANEVDGSALELRHAPCLLEHVETEDGVGSDEQRRQVGAQRDAEERQRSEQNERAHSRFSWGMLGRRIAPFGNASTSVTL